MASSSDLSSLKTWLTSISFTQPIARKLVDSIVKAINDSIRGDALKSLLADHVPCEAFALQEVMVIDRFYDRIRTILELLELPCPSTRTTRDMLILRIMLAIYDEENADRVFEVFRENRRSLRQANLNDSNLYGSDAPAPEDTINVAPTDPHLALSSALNNLNPSKMRDIIDILLSNNEDANANERRDSCEPQKAPAATTPTNTGPRAESTQRFRLESALGKLQSYYTKAPKYSGDFEDDFEDALTEFGTACRGQLAPDTAKPELFRLALSGRALTYYKTIDAPCLPWSTVQLKFRSQFMSRTKRAEIVAELDTLHISTMRGEKDTDRQALDKVIARLDKLSLMAGDDDRKDEPKIRRLHSAIAQEQWTYFALCKLPVVYTYEEMVSILRKSITDLSAFTRQRKKVTPTNEVDKNVSSISPTSSPWSDATMANKPPPLDPFFNQRSPSEPKRRCFNCEQEGCLIGRCPKPLDLKKIRPTLNSLNATKRSAPRISAGNQNALTLPSFNRLMTTGSTHMKSLSLSLCWLSTTCSILTMHSPTEARMKPAPQLRSPTLLTETSR